MAALRPPENEAGYPEPNMFGDLPATGFFVRHARNVELDGIEVRTLTPDARPAVWMQNVDGARLSRLQLPPSKSSFHLEGVRDFELRTSSPVRDKRVPHTKLMTF